MKNRNIVAALEAVQAAMKAEVTAQADFLEHRTPATQASWATARTLTDAAWARLWDSNKDRVPEPDVSGAEWARSMRAKSFGARSSSESDSATG